MDVSCLVEEILKYCTLTKLLQKSLQDTRKTFHDINETKCVVDSEFTDILYVLEYLKHQLLSLINYVFKTHLTVAFLTLHFFAIVQFPVVFIRQWLFSL